MFSIAIALYLACGLYSIVFFFTMPLYIACGLYSKKWPLALLIVSESLSSYYLQTLQLPVWLSSTVSVALMAIVLKLTSVKLIKVVYSLLIVYYVFDYAVNSAYQMAETYTMITLLDPLVFGSYYFYSYFFYYVSVMLIICGLVIKGDGGTGIYSGLLRRYRTDNVLNRAKIMFNRVYKRLHTVG